ncbi:nucleotidyltransferase-like protein [Paenibacillus sp. CMAA1364]
MNLRYKDMMDEECIGSFVYDQQSDQLQGAFFQGFDKLILVITNSNEFGSKVSHVMYDDKQYKIMRICYKEFRRVLVACDNADIVRCFLEGELVGDTDERLAKIRAEFQAFEQPFRDQKMFLEFSRFLKLYLDSKQYLSEGHVMDAYHSVTDSLHHWARIELIERGIRPKSNVWEQVRGLDTAVHKLYQELTVSDETAQQKVELVLLGCEFSVITKMAECTCLLINVIKSRVEPWSIEELMQHTDLDMVSDEVPLVLSKLVFRSKIKVVKPANGDMNNSKYDILYTVL